MKATLRYTLMGLTFAGLTFLSTSCRKDLCYDHDEHGLSVKVNRLGTGMGTYLRL